jgi:hypothetical protein
MPTPKQMEKLANSPLRPPESTIPSGCAVTRPTIRYEYEPHNAVKRTLAAFGRDVVPRELMAPADAAPIAGLAA